MFTEVPHDMTAQRGQDVEMACSFRGAGTPSYSLEIQWWYIRNHLEWTDQQPWTTNEVSPEEETPKDATKISVVKVVGSNISHKLRLSRVKTSDEGTYECRVIDFSDEAGARHHRVRAYLQLEHGKRPQAAPHHGHSHGGDGPQHNAARELKRSGADNNHSDCSNEPSCAL
uniref:V-set and transmembrane domain-containing protein 2-like protein n=1 Tax=Poecilia formosa TaxID=48698 RepID=A0A096MH18_POEFO